MEQRGNLLAEFEAAALKAYLAEATGVMVEERRAHMALLANQIVHAGLATPGELVVTEPQALRAAHALTGELGCAS